MGFVGIIAEFLLVAQGGATNVGHEKCKFPPLVIHHFRPRSGPNRIRRLFFSAYAGPVRAFGASRPSSRKTENILLPLRPLRRARPITPPRVLSRPFALFCAYPENGRSRRDFSWTHDLPFLYVTVPFSFFRSTYWRLMLRCSVPSGSRTASSRSGCGCRRSRASSACCRRRT